MRSPAVLCLSILLAACKGAEDADVGTETGGPTSDTEAIDPRFEALAAAIDVDLEANLATAAQVAVLLDGEVHYVGGFGTAEPNGERAVGRDTLFMIGSDTKKIAALSLLQKVAAGDVALDDTVGELLPALDMALAPDFLDATVHQLISQQGGIVDGVDFQHETDDARLAEYTYGDFASAYYPLAPPGRFWNYANPNVSIAGLIDETVDGRPWADIVTEDLFVPLGMTRTVARKSEVDEDYALGFGYSDLSDTVAGSVKLPKIWESGWTRPAGLVWSTAEDQARLADFLVDGDDTLLDRALLDEVHGAHVPLYPDLPGAYGYGLFVDEGVFIGEDYHQVPVWTHGGNTFTHTSTLYVLPEQRFAVVILSNGYGDVFTHSVVTAISSLVDLPAPSEPPEVAPIDPAALETLVGTFHDPFNVGDMVISVDGEGLRVDMPTLDQLAIPYEHELVPISNRVWLLGVQGLTVDVSFIDGPDGEMWLRNRSFAGLRAPPLAMGGASRAAPSREAVEAALLRLRFDPVPEPLRAAQRLRR